MISNVETSKLFRHFDKSEGQCRNIEIVSTISTCRNSLVSAGNFSQSKVPSFDYNLLFEVDDVALF